MKMCLTVNFAYLSFLDLNITYFDLFDNPMTILCKFTFKKKIITSQMLKTLLTHKQNKYVSLIKVLRPFFYIYFIMTLYIFNYVIYFFLRRLLFKK